MYGRTKVTMNAEINGNMNMYIEEIVAVRTIECRL